MLTKKSLTALSAALLTTSFIACSNSATPFAGASSGRSLAEYGAAATSGSSYACPAALTSSGQLNCAALPIGDRKFSTSAPKKGYIYTCNSLSGSPVVSNAPWLNTTAQTWNAVTKVVVSGSVSWSGSFSQKATNSSNNIVANLLPVSPHTTGTFPITSSQAGYTYDRNPNKIQAHSESLTLSRRSAKNRTRRRSGSFSH